MERLAAIAERNGFEILARQGRLPGTSPQQAGAGPRRDTRGLAPDSYASGEPSARALIEPLLSMQSRMLFSSKARTTPTARRLRGDRVARAVRLS